MAVKSSGMAQDASPIGMVPLVLHRIVRDVATEWEDVHEDQLRRIVAHIGGHAATLCHEAQESNGRWLLTFDDGCVSDYEIVFPLLLESGLAATFFLITERVGKPGYLDWTMVEEMQRHGMCFGSHGHTHRRLTELAEDEVSSEFVTSRQVLGERLGVEVRAFSFPFGAYNSSICERGFAAGYSRLCTSDHGMAAADDRLMPRNSVHSAMGWREIHKLLEPDFRTRMYWRTEDALKKGIKRMLGDERYASLRNRIFHERH